MKNLKLFLPGYVLIVAALYHYSYWSKFGVNILEYAGIQDLASMAVFPFVASIAGLLVGNLVSMAQSLIVDNKMRLFAFGISMLFFLIWMAAGAGLAFLLAAFFLTILLVSGRVSVDLISSHLKEDSVRRLAVGWVILVIPALAFLNGGMRADNILNGGRYSFVAVNGENYRYVGFVSGNFFLYSPDNESLLIAPQDLLGVVEQQFHPKYPERRTLLEMWRDSDEDLEDKLDGKVGKEPTDSLQ